MPRSGRSPGERIGYPLQFSWASLVAQLVKKKSAMWETWVRSLGWEDPLEKEKAIHSGILAWRIPWTVYNPWGRKEFDATELNFPPIPQIEGDLSLKLSSILNVCPFGSADKQSLN